MFLKKKIHKLTIEIKEKLLKHGKTAEQIENRQLL